MSLHPDLNNLTLLCREIISCDDASKVLDYRRAKATSPTTKLLFELARDEMNKELEIKCRRVRHDLNNFYLKHEVAFFKGGKENATQTRDEQESS